MTLLRSRLVALVAFALCSSAVYAGNVPVAYTSSGTLDLSSGTDYFGWSGSTVSISTTVSNMTPTSVTSLANGGVQDVYNAIINITGFQPNQAGTMTLTWYPGTGGTDSVSVAMTYSNFGLTTTVTETLNNVNMPSASPSALLNAVLSSPFDQVSVTSNWGENATFGVTGDMNSSNKVAIAPEPATVLLVLLPLMVLAGRQYRRQRLQKVPAKTAK